MQVIENIILPRNMLLTLACCSSCFAGKRVKSTTGPFVGDLTAWPSSWNAVKDVVLMMLNPRSKYHCANLVTTMIWLALIRDVLSTRPASMWVRLDAIVCLLALFDENIDAHESASSMTTSVLRNYSSSNAVDSVWWPSSCIAWMAPRSFAPCCPWGR